MDEVSLFYKVSVLAATLIIGLVVGGIAYYRMAHTN